LTITAFSLLGYTQQIKEQRPVMILAISEYCRFPQFNEMDATEGYIGDGLAGSAFSPFRYGIEENIGAVVNASMIVQISKKYIMSNNSPLFIIQSGESFQVSE
jgi:hypothetical protein